MRIFINQTNIFETEPVTDEVSEDILDSLDIFVKIYDSNDVLVTGSDVTVGYVAEGVYRTTIPVLTSLVNKTEYQIEVLVKSGATNVWYFKGPITAIIRKSLDQ